MDHVSRTAAVPGAKVDLTLGCGFCFPPCVGPKGEKHPAGSEHGACIPGTEEEPPTAFPISLVPIGRAPGPRPCGPRAVCPPAVAGAPRRPPYSYLGRAVGPSYVKRPQGGRVPLYRLHFIVPRLPAGRYAYVIYCDVCRRGKGGSLISDPEERRWRLDIRPGSR
ncbi:MAG: hypothetical protein QM729_03830 [Solirubrobacterales bacterium]